MASVIEANEVSVRFGGIMAVNCVTLHVDPGERCGIIGPNGAGKTTFLDVLSGIRRPSQGRVLFDGVDVSREGPTRASRRGLRRTFQRHQPFGWLSVEDNVLVALEWPRRGQRVFADLLSLPAQKRRCSARLEIVREVLDQCGLTHVASRPAASLPIGQVRLLEFARAVVGSPKLVLLDEPTSGLAQNDAQRLSSVMMQLNESLGCSYLLVEHDVDFVVQICNRLVVLDQGAILADGEPERVLREQSVIEAYIGNDKRT